MQRLLLTFARIGRRHEKKFTLTTQVRSKGPDQCFLHEAIPIIEGSKSLGLVGQLVRRCKVEKKGRANADGQRELLPGEAPDFGLGRTHFGNDDERPPFPPGLSATTDARALTSNGPHGLCRAP